MEAHSAALLAEPTPEGQGRLTLDWRRKVAFPLGPALFVLTVLLPTPQGAAEAAFAAGQPPVMPQVALGTLLWILVWWVTEALPLGLATLVVPLVEEFAKRVVVGQAVREPEEALRVLVLLERLDTCPELVVPAKGHPRACPWWERAGRKRSRWPGARPTPERCGVYTSNPDIRKALSMGLTNLTRDLTHSRCECVNKYPTRTKEDN